jgi:hypothetical protein
MSPEELLRAIFSNEHESEKMKTNLYARKSFQVEAVKVTFENIEDLASWCGGEIETQETRVKNVIQIEKFIRVPVTRPANEKQTRAYIGDYILKSDNSFKVYTERAFLKSFEPVVVYTEEQARTHANQHEDNFPEPSVTYTDAQAAEQAEVEVTI